MVKKRTLMGISLAAMFGVLGLCVLAPTGAQERGQTQAAATQVSDASIAGAERLSDAFRKTAATLRPSVVTISARVKPQQVRLQRGMQGQLPQELLDMLEQRGLGGIEIQPNDQDDSYSREAGVGSGIVVSSDGYILTNNHVVSQADSLEVELPDGRIFAAEIVGSDDMSDVAVLKIEADNLVAARLGDSSKMQVGDWVVAIGSPFGLDQTVTAGIISARNRQTGIISGLGGYEDFLQTDAAINPGNSGGPLVNLRGEVVGINTAINSSSGSNAGIGFAIPANVASRIMSDLRTTGKVVRGFIGASLDTVSARNASQYNLPSNVRRGVIITNVGQGLPAAEGGLRPSDVVVAVGNRQVKTHLELRSAVAMTRPGQTVQFQVYRDGKPMKLNIVVGEQTPAKLNSLSGRLEIPTLGITVQQLTPSIASRIGLDDSTRGLVVVELEGSGAGYVEMELRPGDLIQAVNGTPVTDAATLESVLSKADMAQLQLTIQRDGRVMRLPRL